jgi:hypothetical protein
MTVFGLLLVELMMVLLVPSCYLCLNLSPLNRSHIMTLSFCGTLGKKLDFGFVFFHLFEASGHEELMTG